MTVPFTDKPTEGEAYPRATASTTEEGACCEHCDAARAAGAAQVRRGDPGYGSHLDRDGDGVACE
ncbi:excalibur calcium-binding domain-containing protein [Glycomyces arizonensis]|uniref:excalibur calcium-binding domain-containing protein n=1 Tax=Glycomyces arizonensis TaxID=256035 RepID=UPI003F6DB122